MSELRYHPFLDQWVITATHRQDRTFHPPPDYNPLAPTKPGGFPTEVPFETYDIVVFENKFPSLQTPAPEPAVEGTDVCPVQQSAGACEVVCYSENPDSTLATMPYSQIRKLTRVWRERYMALAERDEVEYIMIFENKGKEIGVTLTHPHGQIYAYPYIPPVQRTHLESQKRHLEKTGNLLMEDWLRMERQDGRRVVHENETFVAILPFFARYPYEVHVAPKTHLRDLSEMAPSQLDDLAEVILNIARRYDGLFADEGLTSMPYIMSLHQQPAVPGYEFDWFHIEFYPPYRTAQKLKYLAGSEAAAGAFINDTLPEETAQRLRAVEITPTR
jgi:UDPglucose--hexose-1-phosphate uridylyltransferase